LIGLGKIAQAVVRRAAGFGMRIIASDPFLSKEAFAAFGVGQATLGEVLQDSDIVSLHVPLTDQTHHLIGRRELQLMRPKAILVNTCRGPVVDEAALVVALREGWIAGAGLDVMEREPIGAEDALCGLSNVVLAPHSASRSAWTDRERHIRAAQEVAAVLAGLRPRAVWNPAVLARLDLR
jgi:phosphoglycerate dehydrogenase-like enzyme